MCYFIVFLSHNLYVNIMKLRVKEICKSKGITLAELAQSMEVAPESLSRSVNGNPSLSTMENIATALGVELVDLFEKRGDFVALVSVSGTHYRFDSVEALRSFVNGLE